MELKKSIRIALAIILVAAFVFLPTIPVNATEAQPLYNNLASTSISTVTSLSGVLSVSAKFDSFDDEVLHAEITTYIEKRVLGLFWSRVDIGIANNQWIDVLNSSSNSVVHAAQLPSNGTYRAVVQFSFSNSSGETDQETKTSEIVY